MTMMPEDVGDIANSYMHGDYSCPAGQPTDTSQHREKEHPAGDQLNPPIAWYNLVAQPVPRKLWETTPKAMAAVNAEWDKLRKADDGKGTGRREYQNVYGHQFCQVCPWLPSGCPSTP